MSFSRFHPIVQRWFTSTLGEPTPAQTRGWASIRDGRHTLIAAPTGSGKTLAAFLAAIDDVFQEGLRAPLPDEVRVLYVSPLKALSADIHKNLAEPRRGIRQHAQDAGLDAPRITAAVRTGDTSASERAAMLRTPPHILVTTPESLYLLLTSERSRHMLRTVRTVIVDEIHAVIGGRRGAHLALSLERLQHVVQRPLLRLGLSATQKPIEDVARYLVGADGSDCAIVDEGHRRTIDLGIEIPRSTLDAVMSHEVWEEYHDRLQALIEAHRTTLIFVNTRRMAERLARHLSDRLGEDAVTAHHGSLSKEKRLDAETRLKTGRLRALVATASLELGIDIGHVDLVCQIGSPHRIATLLQRVGRSGHTIAGMPKGRVFPASRDDLIECAALLRSVARGELDAIVQHDAPLDVLAQQIVAETSAREMADEDELFALVRRAWPYRALDRSAFDAVVSMAAEGFSTRRGRRAALLHRDEVNARVRGRRGSRLLAQTCGGAIPEIADYRVVLDPEETFIGTLNEDFAIESSAGDVFQLGNASWRVLQVAAGSVRVADAKGAPPTIPFWLGEAPARSDELSRAVSDLRAAIERRASDGKESLADWLRGETGLEAGAAEQIVDYFVEGRRALGVIPTQETLVLERFFDESGGMQLVLHAPFGSRINKAWGLALRKRFCRQFNFELQAAATEDALLLSLGPQHSFPLSDVFRYLHPESTRDVLVQAFLDAPVFQTRWRWNTTIALAVPRARGGRRIAPQLQRMLADDLMAAVFPDAAACLENIPGDREIPDHPLVNQTIRDCLQEAMDFEGLRAVLGRIHRGELRLVARDTPEPSVFAHEILNAKPYAFLDDAPLEERRAHAVQSRRAGAPSSADDLGTLDPSAIDRVREEARPDPRHADELHDTLQTVGFLSDVEASRLDRAMFDVLVRDRRACRAGLQTRPWLAAERIPEIRAIHPDLPFEPALDAPPSRSRRTWTRADAIAELLRSRLTISGPTTASALAASLGIDDAEADSALLTLEGEGVVLRGYFTPRTSDLAPRTSALEWCDRALLARIHRYTLNRLRAEIEPVTPADFMRFLFDWQHVAAPARLTGIDGLREIVVILDGFEVPASAWERSVLPARLDHYEPSLLDMLCLSGEVCWARFSAGIPTGMAGLKTGPTVIGGTPIALFLREHANAWRTGRGEEHHDRESMLTDDARAVLDVLRTRGASFFSDLAAMTRLDADAARAAIGTLVASGLVASDGFSGLRALVWAAQGKPVSRDRRTNFAGRWTAVDRSTTDPRPPQSGYGAAGPEPSTDLQAWALLRRYGIVFRRLLTREPNAAPWRELTRIYRRLEARGEVRGGRFVSGMSGEQFALPRAVERLREVRRTRADGALVTISAADPLNLAGIVTSGERIRAAGGNRLVYRDGVPVAVREGEYVRELAPIDPEIAGDVSRALSRRRVPALLRR
jgi:ATP-dependent helicase Lhr and Lhr-like helicase